MGKYLTWVIIICFLFSCKSTHSVFSKVPPKARKLSTSASKTTINSITPYCDTFYNVYEATISVRYLENNNNHVYIRYHNNSSWGEYISGKVLYTDSSYTQYYWNNEIMFTGVQENNSTPFRFGHPYIRQGIFTFYDPLGNKEKQETYVENRLHGKYFEFYKNGAVKKTGHYYYNELHGTWEHFYNNGIIEKEEGYRYGRLDGKYREYYANGRLKVSGQYVDGQKDSTWDYFDTAGMLADSETFMVALTPMSEKEDEIFETFFNRAEIAEVSRFLDGYGAPALSSAIDSSIRLYCNKNRIKLKNHKKILTTLFIKIDRYAKCSLVAKLNDGTYMVLSQLPSIQSASRPASYYFRYGVSYFEVKYTIAR